VERLFAEEDGALEIESGVVHSGCCSSLSLIELWASASCKGRMHSQPRDSACLFHLFGMLLLRLDAR
jgi:hypothetical protein